MSRPDPRYRKQASLRIKIDGKEFREAVFWALNCSTGLFELEVDGTLYDQTKAAAAGMQIVESLDAKELRENGFILGRGNRVLA